MTLYGIKSGDAWLEQLVTKIYHSAESKAKRSSEQHGLSTAACTMGLACLTQLCFWGVLYQYTLPASLTAVEENR